VQPSDERSFRAYLWVYWCYAVRWARKEQPEQQPDKAGRVVATLCKAGRFPNGNVGASDTNGKSLAAGYADQSAAYWLRPSPLADDIRLDYATLSNFFHPDRTFTKKIARFAGAAEEFWAQSPATRALDKFELGVLRDIIDSTEPCGQPFLGTILVGSVKDSGVVWIGVRDVAELASLPFEDQALWLQNPAELLSVVHTGKPRLAWLTPERLLSDAQQNPIAWEALGKDLPQAVPPLVTAARGTLVTGVGQTESEMVRIASEQGVPNANGGEYIVIGCPDWQPLATAVLRAGCDVQRITAVPFDLIVSTLSRAPWLWSRHLGDSFDVFYEQPTPLGHSLLGDSVSAEVARTLAQPTMSLSKHKANVLVLKDQWARIAAYQMITSTFADYVIVVPDRRSLLDRGLIVRMIADQLQEGRECLLLIDQMEVGPDLYSLLNELPLQLSVCLLVTAWPDVHGELLKTETRRPVVVVPVETNRGMFESLLAIT